MSSSSSSQARRNLPRRFHQLFNALRIPPASYPYSSSAAARHAINPLVVAGHPAKNFCFERNQYIALGDAVIHRAISKEVCNFFLRRGSNSSAAAAAAAGDGSLRNFTVSHNTVQHVTACFHNALAVRFVAESVVPISAVSNSNEADADAGDADEAQSLTSIFASAETPRRGPSSTRDRRGTSFDWNPHSFAQCDLAPRLSHLIGCIHLFCPDGEQVALEAARRAFFNLDSEHGTNVPYEAAKLLAALCDRYAPVNVARAVLAAQGLRVDVMCRSIGGGRAAVASFAASASAAASAPESRDRNAEASFSSAEGKSVNKRQQQQQDGDGGALVQRQEPTSLSQQQQQQPSAQQRPPVPASSHALGPGRVDLISKWHRATAELQQAPNNSSPEGEEKEVVPADDFGPGWKALRPEVSSFFSSSSGAYPSFDLSRFKFSVADVNGVPPPKDLSQPHYVAKRKQNSDVRDPSFFATADAATGKDGVPLTNSPVLVDENSSSASAGAVQEFEQGAPHEKTTTRQIVETLSQPHTRLFEAVIVRDPLVFSSRLRKEIYADDSAAKDIGQGKVISDMTRERLFRFGKNQQQHGGGGSGGGDENLAGFGDEEEAAKTPSVGPRVVSRGMGMSYGEARTAAALSYLERAVEDLAVL